MKINFDAEILDLDDKPLKDGDSVIQLKHVCSIELTRPEANEGPDKKLEKFDLALKIRKGGEKDLPVEEVALIKELVGKYQTPLVYGRVNQLLDPK